MNYFVLKIEMNETKHQPIIDRCLVMMKSRIPTRYRVGVITLELRDGNEVFGVFESANALFVTLDAIVSSARVFDIELHVGIGIGALRGVELNHQLMSGDAIRFAAQALQEAKRHKRDSLTLIDPLLKANIIGSYSKQQMLLTQLHLYLGLLLKQSTNQQTAVYLLREHPSLTYAQLYDIMEPQSQVKDETKRVNFSRYITRSQLTLMQGIVDTIELLATFDA